MPRPSLLLPLALVPLLAACAAPARMAEPAPAPARANENLHTVLWTQTSVEFRAIALQTYEAAGEALRRALADTAWTAAPEQAGRAGFGALPPAVVLDVDETVLDNSAYQARLVREDGAYDRESWRAWVDEEAATAIPGAVAFTRLADSLGVAVVYLTNRRAEEEPATRRNLEAEGFPVPTAYDAVLTRGERPEWGPSEKAPRRAFVADSFRVLLLVGDNLGDFLPDVETGLAARDALAAPYEGWWGTRWFMLPNPQYGSWEGALFDFDYGLSREEQLRRKYERLRTE